MHANLPVSSKPRSNPANMDLVYVSPTLLEPGSVVPPGNFGKNIAGASPDTTDGWTVAREMVFENARMRFTPHLPSRLTCAFLFTSTAAALAMLPDLRSSMLAPALYSVELVDPEKPWCIADFDAFRMIDRRKFLESTMHAAQVYWTLAAHGVELADRAHELLTLSPIRIKRIVMGHDDLRHHFPCQGYGK